jgi:nicotinamide riboside transporter PnuC
LISNAAFAVTGIRSPKDANMFRLDYISCVLTISSTILVGKKRWEGWVIAGINSVLICVIAVNTSQLGFIPANLFCLALYAYNIWEWRKSFSATKELSQPSPETQSLPLPGAPQMQV